MDSTVNELDSSADLNVFVRCQDEEALEVAKRFRAKGQRTVLDLVVNYFEESYVEGLGHQVTDVHISQVRRMLDVVDGVTCCSQFIADRASRFHQRVLYLPDSVDKRHFTRVKQAVDFYAPQLRAIWSGVSGKARENEPILPILKRLDVPFVLISDWRLLRDGFWLKRLVGRLFSFRWWRYQSFPRLILDGEICVSYRNTQISYNLGHSNFKIAVFMASGVPAIASPVPSYKELLNDGNAGRICYTLDEWEEAIESIHKDRDLLAEWSRAAIAASRPYLTENVVDRYVNLFSDLSKSC